MKNSLRSIIRALATNFIVGLALYGMSAAGLNGVRLLSESSNKTD
jgi:hypothetical protein